ncbi:hypothetical protein RUND412_002354 [Rhizina undulata]
MIESISLKSFGPRRGVDNVPNRMKRGLVRKGGKYVLDKHAIPQKKRADVYDSNGLTVGH